MTVEQIERDMHALQAQIQNRAEKQEIQLKRNRTFAKVITALYVLCGVVMFGIVPKALLENAWDIAGGALVLVLVVSLTAHLIAPSRKTGDV